MAKGLARSIKNRRDYQSATAVVDKLRAESKETAAERRLQALLHEIEKFDGEDGVEDDDAGFAEDVEGLPRRRWSDEGE